MGGRKEIFIKIHYFYVLTSPLGRKFHKDSKKTGLKKFHTISEGSKFLVELSREMTIQILKKLYGNSWPKFEQVTEKIPTPRTLELLLAFDEKSTFDFFAFFSHIKRASI